MTAERDDRVDYEVLLARGYTGLVLRLLQDLLRQISLNAFFDVAVRDCGV